MKILVLSNDEMERSVIHQVVQHNGHEVLMAGDSESAIQLLREGNVRFVIVDRNSTDADESSLSNASGKPGAPIKSTSY